ncbi:MAG: EamA family transporter [Chitinispirillaceae bacterium]|nr:EamA family transporter [Chitinispirillaceae bacterium]
MMLRLHFAVLLFGCAGLFGKFIVLPAIAIVAGRTLFAALFLLALALFANRFSGLATVFASRQRAPLIASGAALALHWWSFFHAIQLSSVAIGLISFSTFPLFVSFAEPLLFREKLRLHDCIAAAAVIAGIVLLIPVYDPGNAVTQGVFWGTISGLTFAAITLLNRHCTTFASSQSIALIQNSVACLCLAPLLCIDPPSPTVADLALLAVLGVVCTAVAHTLFISSLRTVKARTASVIAALEPVYGVLLGFLILHETPTFRTVIGGALILGTAVTLSLKISGRAS